MYLSSSFVQDTVFVLAALGQKKKKKKKIVGTYITLKRQFNYDFKKLKMRYI